ncbi:MAG: transcription antitermination factor NusB [Desulfobacterales bacterium]|nr:transcription antitermination factor NusB [Desulfobacterales bacterium]
MRNRTKARELAMQALFYLDILKEDGESDTVKLDRFCIHHQPDEKAIYDFFIMLVNGVLDNNTKIDSFIEGHSQHWKISRMSPVDRNVIRVSIYEMLYCNKTPVEVVINEAIEIGKKYGTDDSGGFINGVLDSIHMELDKKKSIDSPK